MCTHYWVIEMPAGATSKGVCIRCLEEREFENSTDEGHLKRSAEAHKRYIAQDKVPV